MSTYQSYSDTITAYNDLFDNCEQALETIRKWLWDNAKDHPDAKTLLYFSLKKIESIDEDSGLISLELYDPRDNWQEFYLLDSDILGDKEKTISWCERNYQHAKERQAERARIKRAQEESGERQKLRELQEKYGK